MVFESLSISESDDGSKSYHGTLIATQDINREESSDNKNWSVNSYVLGIDEGDRITFSCGIDASGNPTTLLFKGLGSPFDNWTLEKTSSSSGSASKDAEHQSNSDYVIPDSDSRELAEADLDGLSNDELWYARNEIYARYGRGFKDSTLQAYFDSKAWYTKQYEPDAFSESMLSSVEKKNANTIKAKEKKNNSPHV